MFLSLPQQQDGQVIRHGQQDEDRTAFFEHLSDYDHLRTCQDYLRRRCPDTTRWILSHAAFKPWLDGRSYPCLWLSGKIGCGKTLVTSTVVHFLGTTYPYSDTFVAHFFYSRSSGDGLKASHLFKSFTKQILQHLTRTSQPYPKEVVKNVKSLSGPGSYPASLGEIVEDVFFLACRAVPDAIYIVDGLDECERSEMLEVFAILRQMISQNNSRILVSGRDGIDLIQAIPRAVTIAVANQGNEDDIRKFIDWKIDEKSRDRPLTSDTALLQDITAKLLERADCMFLWVHLQLDMLWEECYTDADVRTALENLPKTLSETYDRCIARINKRQNELARKVLYWVCVAIKPFSASQLQEVLAMDPETGICDSQRILPAKEIVKLCSHLVIWDTNNNIRLTHSSVNQFLKERSTGIDLLWSEYTLAKARAELAELCLTHLLPWCSGRSLEHYKGPGDQADASPILQTIKKHVPLSDFLGFLTPQSAQIPWPPRLPPSKVITEPSAFFEFAKYHWAPLTDSIDSSSSLWRKFRRIALTQETTRPVHPWEAVGESADSHFMATLAWAIDKKHRPLFSLLVGLDRPQLNSEVFNIPLYHYSNVPLLHLAARSNFPEALNYLMKVSKHPLLDCKKRLALHHAAETGSIEAMRQLLGKFRISINDRDIKGHTPLHLATMNNHDEMIILLVKKGAMLSITDRDGQTPFWYAIRHCEVDIIQALISNGAYANTSSTTHRSLLFAAAERLDPQVISLVIANGAQVAVVDGHGRTPKAVAADSFFSFSRPKMSPGAASESVTRVLLEAVELGNTSVVDCLLQLGTTHEWCLDQPISPLNAALRQGNFAIAELLFAAAARRPNPRPDTPAVRICWRDIFLRSAFHAAKALKYDRLLHAAQAVDGIQKILPVCRDGASPPTPSIMATLACIFGHAEVIKALLNERSYRLNEQYIMWSVLDISTDVADGSREFSKDVADRLFGRRLYRMFNTPDTALQLLSAIANNFDRADIEVVLLNSIYLRISHELDTENPDVVPAAVPRHPVVNMRGAAPERKHGRDPALLLSEEYRERSLMRFDFTEYALDGPRESTWL
ncbi:hypothetical protein BJX76DRAFT_358742 [Aspergillus varians]